MHELAIASAVVDAAVRHGGGRRVAVVSLKVGELRQVVPESLTFYFEIAARGTPCEGAHLDLEPIDALLSCGACGNGWAPADGFRCPRCGAAGADVVRGDELEVESIEVEDPVHA
jgi:hydrogenase nickel incorporation protein HypA/HybF